MPSFSKFVVFMCIIILLPLIVNIVDNAIKIFNVLKYKNCISDKIVEFSKREFVDFILEFFERSYKYEFDFKNDDIYLKDGNIYRLLYCDNKSCEKFTINDARKVIGICESKGVKDVFIFTTKILSNDVIDFFKGIGETYDVKYIYGNDLNVNYKEFVCKFYNM